MSVLEEALLGFAQTLGAGTSDNVSVTKVTKDEAIVREG
jgi:hypothetical protein